MMHHPSITKVDIEAGIGCFFFEEAANAWSGSLCASKTKHFHLDCAGNDREGEQLCTTWSKVQVMGT
jgi:hypothetical protein